MFYNYALATGTNAMIIAFVAFFRKVHLIMTKNSLTVNGFLTIYSETLLGSEVVISNQNRN